MQPSTYMSGPMEIVYESLKQTMMTQTHLEQRPYARQFIIDVNEKMCKPGSAVKDCNEFLRCLKALSLDQFITHLIQLLHKTLLTKDQVEEITTIFLDKKKQAAAGQGSTVNAAPVEKQERADRVFVKSEPGAAQEKEVPAADAAPPAPPVVEKVVPVADAAPPAPPAKERVIQAADAAPPAPPAKERVIQAADAAPPAPPAKEQVVPAAAVSASTAGKKRTRADDAADDEIVPIHSNQTITVKELKEMSEDELKVLVANQKAELELKKHNHVSTRKALVRARTAYLEAIEWEEKAMAAYTKAEQNLDQVTTAIDKHRGAGH